MDRENQNKTEKNDEKVQGQIFYLKSFKLSIYITCIKS